MGLNFRRYCLPSLRNAAVLDRYLALLCDLELPKVRVELKRDYKPPQSPLQGFLEGSFGNFKQPRTSMARVFLGKRHLTPPKWFAIFL